MRVKPHEFLTTRVFLANSSMELRREHYLCSTTQ
jgi:hypothetical protein